MIGYQVWVCHGSAPKKRRYMYQVTVCLDGATKKRIYTVWVCQDSVTKVIGYQVGVAMVVPQRNVDTKLQFA